MRIYVVCTFVWIASIVSGIKPRHEHGDCKIVINEIVLLPAQKFVEIAKICEKKTGRNINTLTLTGYSVIVFQAEGLGTQPRCVFKKKLHDSVLTAPIQQQDNSRGIAAANIPARGIPGASTTPASPEIFQENGIGFLSVDFSNVVIQDGILGISLIQLSAREMRNMLPCELNKVMTEEQSRKVLEAQVDFIEISLHKINWVETNLQYFYSTQENIANPYKLEIPHEVTASSKGISKCDKYAKSYNPEGFEVSRPSPNFPNICKKSAPMNAMSPFIYPYKFQGSALQKQSQQLIINAVTALEHFRNSPSFFNQPATQIVSTLLHVSSRSIVKIKKRHQTNSVETPGKKRRRDSVMDHMTDDNRKLLFDVITSFYNNHEIPKVRTVRTKFVHALREKQLRDLEAAGPQPEESPLSRALIQCGDETFRKVLHRVGYKFGRLNHRDAVLFDYNKIKWRANYLETIRKNDESGEYEVVYIDETWHDPHSIPSKGWTRKCFEDFTERRHFAFPKAKISRGARLIIVAGGGKMGFVPGSSLVYKISANEAEEDYHGNINAQSFMSWFTNFLDKLEEMSSKKFIIVADNAPYHSVITAPKANARKAEMIEWLSKQKDKGYDVPNNFEKLLRPAIYNIMRDLKKQFPSYRIDEVAKARGHKVVRIPPYNCDLNPIELIWARVKSKLMELNKEQDVDLQLIRAKQILATFSKDIWEACVLHIKKLEEQYRIADRKFDETLDANPELEDEVILDNAEADDVISTNPHDSDSSDSHSD